MSSAPTNPKAISKSTRPGNAIDRCDRARAAAYKAEYAASKSRALASLTAAEAYRHAMPSLSSARKVRDFIACIAHGLLIGVIDESMSSKLLYAARIALTTFREAKRKQQPAPAEDPPLKGTAKSLKELNLPSPPELAKRHSPTAFEIRPNSN